MPLLELCPVSARLVFFLFWRMILIYHMSHEQKYLVTRIIKKLYKIFTVFYEERGKITFFHRALYPPVIRHRATTKHRLTGQLTNKTFKNHSTVKTGYRPINQFFHWSVNCITFARIFISPRNQKLLLHGSAS